MSSEAPAEQFTAIPANGIAPVLKAAREAKGLTLPECAEQLRIRQGFLSALEEGRNKDLPGGTYAVGFLRTYAEHLGLDGEEMVRRFRQEGMADFNQRTELLFPSPVSEGRIPGGAVLFLGVVLAAVAYGGWYFLSSRQTVTAEKVPSLPERLTSLLNRQAAVTADKPAAAPEAPAPSLAPQPAAEEAKAPDAGAAPKPETDVVPPNEGDESKPGEPAKTVAAPEPAKVEAPKAEPAKPDPKQAKKAEPAKPAEIAKAPEPPKAEQPKPAEVAKAPEPAKPPVKAPEPPKSEAPKAEVAKAEPAKPAESAPVAPAPAPAPAPTPEGKTIGAENADSRVVLKAANDDCWLQVREMDGTLVLSRLLRKGDSLRLPNRQGLTLMVGNAGALEVNVDGKKAPALGNTGQVRRDVKLDPDKLLGGG